MFAIIKTGGKQFRVSPGQEIYVEKLPVNEEENYVFEEVLAIENDKKILGTPFVEGANVEAKVLKQGKAKKIIVAKYKRRKKYRLKQGHRQLYTKLLITKITV
ncbi:MAG: 50S ribosomal protein L21 ['Conium maculatum' witches'-broom phytoplasma]|uniref:Large ribosomal subunit protein bL21 n=1 Tax=Candidatus Phytoplasma pruni TaxID=479893 RepID=A0A851HJM9_9MOLU|nr:50S ribosomal protein L21 [Candidatus Phytoplasma pruni]MEC4559272.1 50S ribosomal protein L21 ['Conium maculatum' witches'-broom phytoplasma]NWN45746.1 50S ribosomal protein L21 [Candidatus Phytoplasma pruni]